MVLKEKFDAPNKKRYYPTYQMNLTQQERALLERWADGRPISDYIKDVLFVEERKPQRSLGIVLEDKKLFAKALGFLGKSRLSSNVNQLAKAANTGSLQVTPETEKLIQESMHAILWMRDLLMQAMRLKPTSKDKEKSDDTER